MNSQFLPGSGAQLNEQSHQRLLNEAGKVRRIRKAFADHSTEKQIGPSVPKPSLLEPLFSAILTAALALQLALLIGF